MLYAFPLSKTYAASSGFSTYMPERIYRGDSSLSSSSRIALLPAGRVNLICSSSLVKQIRADIGRITAFSKLSFTVISILDSPVSPKKDTKSKNSVWYTFCSTPSTFTR